MGRIPAVLLVLGLLAAGGWFLQGRSARPGDSAVGPPTPSSGTSQATEGGSNPGGLPGGRPPVADFSSGVTGGGEAARLPGSPPEGSSSAAVAGGDIRSLLQAGRPEEAVARAMGLAPESLGNPACATAARDAALALASGPSDGSVGRIARADAARRLLGRLVVADLLPLSSVKDRLDGLNREVLFARREVPGVVFKGAIQPGDTLDRLMKKDWKGRVHAGYGVVLWLNSIAGPDRLRVGSIWVPEEPVRMVVRKREHRLWVLLGDVPVREFSVGLGMNGRTPEGTFEIEEMMPRPDYWAPGGKRIPFGQPGNPLGTRWMGFRDTPDAQGFGIHGTEEPQSIGKDESQGCVRMLNAEVEQLFTWITVGTRVDIRP